MHTAEVIARLKSTEPQLRAFGARTATTIHPGVSPKAAKKGTKTNRVKARQHARAIYAVMQKLIKQGITESALAAKLETAGLHRSPGALAGELLHPMSR